MSSELIDELVCPQCLRYLSKYSHLDKKTNVEASKGNVNGHMRRCELPYQDLVAEEGELRVFCVGPKSLKTERDYSAHVAQTMSASEEIWANAGWYSCKDPEDEKTYHPHAFVPVVDGSTAGILVVRKKMCATRRGE